MSIMSDFKTFAMRGNVVDMAVGIIIGTAFTAIVNSLVADIVMPPLGLLIGGIDFTNFSVTLKEATATHPAVIMSYGKLIQTIFNFIIIAFVIFLIIRLMNKLKTPAPAAPAAPAPPSKEELLLAEIRDILKKENMEKSDKSN